MTDSTGTLSKRVSGYRPDVDGLRAIAIVAVVLYHAHVPGFGGGFVGVDVFFVISGYLIIGLLYREFERSGSLSLANFFERRIRRLAPALILVLAVTLVLGLMFLTPINGEQQGLAKSAIATVALVSNLYFARHTGGYFDGPAEAQPLLHTWSLSVEEQFYLFWPLVVLAAGRFALRRGHAPKRVIGAALLVLFALSLALSLWLTSSQPQMAFFSSPTRAWEFAVGGLVFFALHERGTMARHGGVLAATGLLAIGLAVNRFDSSMAFPGYLALLPVLGTAAVIAGCAQAPQALVTRCLSWRPVVAIGLVSYGWYLWHWPLLAIARVHTLGEIGPLGIATLCLISLALAAMTYRFIETPIRGKHVALMATRRPAFGFGAMAIIGIVALSGALGVYAKHVWPRQPENRAMRDALGDMRKVRGECWQARPYSGALLVHPDCDLPRENGSPKILVWGDSHASSLIPLVTEFASQHHTSMRIRFMPECPPMQDYSPTLIGVSRSRGCEQFNRDVLTEVGALRPHGLRSVVIAARWWAYLQTPEAADAARKGMRATLLELQRLGVRVVIAAPVPELPHEAPACLARRSIAACGVDRRSAEQRRATAMALLEENMAAVSQTRLVDPMVRLCDAAFCSPLDAGDVLYSDAHHLSEAGSLVLWEIYAPVLSWSLDEETAVVAEPLVVR